MALTREQFQELRNKGLTVAQIVSFERGEKPEDLKRKSQLKKQTEGNMFERTVEPPKGRSVSPNIPAGTPLSAEKMSDFVGGRQLAEGAGLALAAPGIQRTLSQEQEQTFALQKKVLQAIRNARATGKDTSRLEKALKSSQDLATVLDDAQQDFIANLPSNKQIIGSSVRLAGTLGAGAVARGASALTGVKGATSLGAGALRGAGAGVLSGGVVGGIQGGGIAAEQEKSVVAGAAVGAGIGAVGGGVLGAIAGGISGRVAGQKIAREEFAKQLVAPKDTPTIRAEAIQQGRLQDPTLFGKAKIAASKRDEKLAEAVKDIVSRDASVGRNVDAIRYKVSTTNNGVRTYIEDHKIPFNTNQLRSKLETGKEDLRLIFASDTNAEKTYKAVADEFMKHVQKKDTLGLFDARQNFDQIPAIRKLLETQGLGENTRKEIVLAVRRAANEYVAAQLPKGNTYRADLMNESYMLEALGNLSEKSANIIGKNKLQLLAQDYPIIKYLLGGLAGGLTAGLGFALGRGVGAGGSITGSTD